ncbi:MAG: penicillin-binding protein 2, partial [Armatimonadota bacterium]|nr:penicillin-binding protein 2 [Armatimonadota bacterium]
MRASARIPTLKQRLEWTFCFFAIAFFGLGWRLFQIQVLDHAFYKQQADRYHFEEITIPPSRGMLRDRDGTPLAQSLPCQSVYADPTAMTDIAAVARPLAGALNMDARSVEARLRMKRESVWLKRHVDESTAKAVMALGLPGVSVVEAKDAPGSGRDHAQPMYSIRADPRKVKDPEATVARLAPILQLPSMELLNRITRPRSFVWVKRQVDGASEAAVRALNLKGVHFIRESRRQYPFRKLAANVIGYTNIDGVGIAGLEKQLDTYLAGRPGCIEAEVDALKRIIPGTVRRQEPVVDGYNVTLTLSARIQHLAEQAIEKAFTTYRAAGVCAVVLDPRTGEVLAMANRPTYQPDRPGDSHPENHRNRCVTDIYEPGSTMKAITIAAALEEKVVTPSRYFYCGGTYRVGKHSIRCVLHGPYHAGHGLQTIAGILRESCNIGTAQIGAALKPNRLYRYIADFGFIGDTRLHLIGEERGDLSPPDTWPAIKLANVSFGQGVAVTPLQM